MLMLQIDRCIMRVRVCGVTLLTQEENRFSLSTAWGTVSELLLDGVVRDEEDGATCTALLLPNMASS